jgi:hypothetical protein
VQKVIFASVKQEMSNEECSWLLNRNLAVWLFKQVWFSKAHWMILFTSQFIFCHVFCVMQTSNWRVLFSNACSYHIAFARRNVRLFFFANAITCVSIPILGDTRLKLLSTSY